MHIWNALILFRLSAYSTNTAARSPFLAPCKASPANMFANQLYLTPPHSTWAALPSPCTRTIHNSTVA